MTIYLDLTSTLRNRALTGIQRVVIEYLRALRELETAGELAVMPVKISGGKLCEVSQREVSEILARGRSKRPGQHRGRHWSLWPNFSRRVAIKPSSTLLTLDIFPEALLSYKKHFSKTVAMVHDISALSIKGLVSQKASADLKEYLDSVHTFSHIITPSEDTKKKLEEWWSGGVRLPPISVIEHGLTPVSVNFKNSPVSPKKFLCLGSLETRKNHLNLLKACECLWEEGEKFDLQIVGLKTKSGAAAVEKIRALKKAGYPIDWSGALSDAEVERAWAGAWALVLPSYEEGSGLPVAESLARGVPVVCGVDGALKERARFGGCETLLDVGWECLYWGIKKVLEDDRRMELAAEAREAPVRSWALAAKELLSLLRKGNPNV